LSVTMYGWGLYEWQVLKLVPIVFGFVAPFILSLYLRVIAMHRCRDIGWSPVLPWLALRMAASFGVLGALQSAFLPALPFHTTIPLLVVSIVLGMADFVFLAVIAFVPGQDDSLNIPPGQSDQRDPMPASPNAAWGEQWPLAMPGAGYEGGSSPGSPRSPVRGFGRKGL
jgi:hypothetical protein